MDPRNPESRIPKSEPWTRRHRKTCRPFSKLNRAARGDEMAGQPMAGISRPSCAQVPAPFSPSEPPGLLQQSDVCRSSLQKQGSVSESCLHSECLKDLTRQMADGICRQTQGQTKSEERTAGGPSGTPRRVNCTQNTGVGPCPASRQGGDTSRKSLAKSMAAQLLRRTCPILAADTQDLESHPRVRQGGGRHT